MFSGCWRRFRYGIFFLYLEFLNSFIFVALILCFSCLFVYLFCVSFPFRWLSLSKVDNLFEFLFGAILSEFPWIFFIRCFCSLWRIFRTFQLVLRYVILIFSLTSCWYVFFYPLLLLSLFAWYFGFFMLFFTPLSVKSLVVVIDSKKNKNSTVKRQWS